MKSKKLRLVVTLITVFALLFTSISGTALAESQHHNEEHGSYTFYDDEGKFNELVVVRTNKEIVSELYIEGTLNQKSILDRSNDTITGFKSDGNIPINTTVNQTLTDVEIIDTSSTDISINPNNWGGVLIDTKYSDVWDLHGLLFQNITETRSNQYVFEFDTGTALTSIAASIISFVVFSTFSLNAIVSLIGGIVIGIVAGEIQDTFKGKFEKLTTMEYYTVKADNQTGLRTLKEYQYIWGYNEFTGAEETKFDGQYAGVDWSNDEMLDVGIYNVAIMNN